MVEADSNSVMGSEDYIDLDSIPSPPTDDIHKDDEDCLVIPRISRRIHDGMKKVEVTEDFDEDNGKVRADINDCAEKVLMVPISIDDNEDNDKDGDSIPDCAREASMVSISIDVNKESNEINGCKATSPSEDNGTISHEAMKIKNTEHNQRSGSKRRRLSYADDQPYVHIIYNYLPRESKKKLSELLHSWAEWHAQNVDKFKSSEQELMECGDEMYFPALEVGEGNGSLLTFWMDKPAKQMISEQQHDCAVQVNEASVPYYDRACIAPLAIRDYTSNLECNDDFPPEATRCFNCGSYSHSLKDCSKPRDNAAINNARNQLKAKRTPASGQRGPQRYYQDSPRGKYEGIKPGLLGAETRQSLGIGELDPPPWLNRMREIGYPPAYLDVDEPDEPSGITIFAEDESKELEEGEIEGAENHKIVKKQKMTVQFPGINAPIPENADERLWSNPFSVPNNSFSGHRFDAERAHNSTNSSSSRARPNHRDNRRFSEYSSLPDEPPGTERTQHNNHGSNSGMQNTPSPSYPNRYSAPQGSNLSRSVSENERWAGSLHDNSQRGGVDGAQNSRYDKGWHSFRQYSPHNVAVNASNSGRYSPNVQSPVGPDYMSSSRRHGRHDGYSSNDKTQRRDRSEDSRHYR